MNPKMPAKRPRSRQVEPGRVHLHHARRAEGLQVAVDSANRDEEPKQPPERSEAENKVHRHRAGRADQHGALAAETIGDAGR